MNGTRRKIGTLIATLGLALTAGGVSAALASGSSSPSPTVSTVSSTPAVNDDGTADQGPGDNQGPGENQGPGSTDDDGHSGHDGDDGSGHDGNEDGQSGHGEGVAHA
jgi:hypothetical protein